MALESFQTISPLYIRSAWNAYVQHIIPGFQVHDRDAYTEFLANYNPEPFPDQLLRRLCAQSRMAL